MSIRRHMGLSMPRRAATAASMLPVLAWALLQLAHLHPAAAQFIPDVPIVTGPFIMSVFSPSVTPINQAQSSWDWALTPPTAPVQPNPLPLGTSGSLVYQMQVIKGSNPTGTYALTTTIQVQSWSTSATLVSVGAWLRGPGGLATRYTATGCSPGDNIIRPGITVTCQLTIPSVQLAGQPSGVSATSAQITFSGFTLQPVVVYAPAPGASSPSGEALGNLVTVNVPPTSQDCATVTQIFDGSGLLPISVSATGVVTQSISNPIAFTPTTVCTTQNLVWTATFLAKASDCQGQSGPAVPRQIRTNFQLTPSPVTGGTAAPLTFNDMTNAAYLVCTGIAPGGGGALLGSLARSGPGAGAGGINAALLPDTWDKDPRIMWPNTTRLDTTTYQWSVSAPVASRARITVRKGGPAPRVNITTTYTRSPAPLPSADWRGTLALAHNNSVRGYAIRLLVTPRLADGSAGTFAVARCPLVNVSRSTVQLIDLPARGMVRCTYALSLPPGTGSALTGLTASLQMVDGAWVNQTRSVDQLTKNAGFVAAKGPTGQGACATVAEALLGGNLTKASTLGRTSNSSKAASNSKGGMLPVQQPQSVCAATTFTWTAALGAPGASTPCKPTQVVLEAAAYPQSGGQRSARATTTLTLDPCASSSNSATPASSPKPAAAVQLPGKKAASNTTRSSSSTSSSTKPAAVAGGAVQPKQAGRK